MGCCCQRTDSAFSSSTLAAWPRTTSVCRRPVQPCGLRPLREQGVSRMSPVCRRHTLPPQRQHPCRARHPGAGRQGTTRTPRRLTEAFPAHLLSSALPRDLRHWASRSLVRKVSGSWAPFGASAWIACSSSASVSWRPSSSSTSPSTTGIAPTAPSASDLQSCRQRDRSLMWRRRSSGATSSAALFTNTSWPRERDRFFGPTRCRDGAHLRYAEWPAAESGLSTASKNR